MKIKLIQESPPVRNRKRRTAGAVTCQSITCSWGGSGGRGGLGSLFCSVIEGGTPSSPGWRWVTHPLLDGGG